MGRKRQSEKKKKVATLPGEGTEIVVWGEKEGGKAWTDGDKGLNQWGKREGGRDPKGMRGWGQEEGKVDGGRAP